MITITSRFLLIFKHFIVTFCNKKKILMIKIHIKLFINNLRKLVLFNKKFSYFQLLNKLFS